MQQEEESAQPRVLVVGGSGYLGQFLLHGLGDEAQRVGYTYSSRPLQSAPQGVAAYQVDLATGSGLQEALSAQDWNVVVNCAAISQPVACEKDPAAARSINVPSRLLQQLGHSADQPQQAGGQGPLLIHISTDQVYDGSRAHWREGDACNPVNEYGRSKLAGEHAVQVWRGGPSVVLRSSIIYGPQPPDPVPRALFLQFVDGVVSRREPTSFFEDEWRCPIYVKDIVDVVRALARQHCERPIAAVGAAAAPPRSLVLNMGGPERLSRVDMARAVAAFRGLSEPEAAACVLPVPAVSVARGVASPADISMDSQLLAQHTGVRTTRFADALPHCLGPPAPAPPAS